MDVHLTFFSGLERNFAYFFTGNDLFSDSHCFAWQNAPTTNQQSFNVFSYKKSETKYRELVENANSIILRVDINGNIIFFNEFAQTFFGYSEEEIIGRSVIGTIIPEIESSGRDLSNIAQEIFNNPSEYTKYINENIKSNGERVWVSWTNRVLFDADGAPIEILCIGTDITEQKRAEENLRLDESRLETLHELGQMTDASLSELTEFSLEKAVQLTKSSIGYLAFANENESVLTMHSWSKNAMNQCAIIDKPTEFQVKDTGLWGEAVRQRKPIITNDYTALHPTKKGYPGGHISIMRHMNIPVFDLGKIVVIAGVGNKETDYDQTDVRQLQLLMEGMWKLIQRKHAEEALRESEERFRTLVQNIPGVCYRCACDNDWTMEYISDDIEMLSGYASREFIANQVRSYASIIHPDDAQLVEKTIIDSRNTTNAFTIEYRIIRSDDDIRWVFEKGQFVFDAEDNVRCLDGVIEDITEHKKTLEDLENSEALYSSLVENLPQNILRKDLKGEFTFVNEYFCKTIGKSKSELIGKTDFDFYPIELAEKYKQDDQQVIKTGQFFETVEINQSINGQDNYVHVLKTPLRDSTGEIIGLQAIFWDITKQRRLEQEYKTLFCEMLDGFSLHEILCNSQGEPSDYRFLAVNPAFERMTGLKAKDIIGKTVLEVMPDTEKHWIETYGRVALTGEPALFENYAKELDKHFEVTAFRPSPNQFACIFADITKRKKSEEALKQSEMQLAESQRIAHLGNWFWDIQTNIIHWSDETYRIFGLIPNESPITNQNFLNFVHPYDSQTLQNAVKNALDNKSSYKLDHRIIRKDGETRFVHEEAEVIFDYDNNPIKMVGTVQDITERKHLEDQLFQSQKMEAIGHLAGGVAHDFNNILMVISGYVSFIIEKEDIDAGIRGDAIEIRTAAERAESLTRQLLAFSRKQVMQSKVINLNKLVINLEKMLRRLIGEDVQLTTHLSPELGQIFADPGQIEQVIMNLAINARDAMPNGGVLVIETSNVYLDQTYAKIHPDIQPGNFIMLAISDTGQGMTHEIQEKIFNPFFTTKEKGKGTGLGLATVYGIVKQSGGNIWVYSEPGKGATFKVYFRQTDKSVESYAKDINISGSSQVSETILVVEDETGVRKIVIRLLEKLGYKILESSNGEEAILECEKHQGKIDLLLTDVIMPKMSGKELSGIISAKYPNIKTLFMSGYTDNIIVHHGVLDEGFELIQKPIAPEELSRKVREVLDTKIFI